MKKDIGKKVLERIEEEQVKPYSKWRFVFHRSVMWSLFATSLLLGSLASGVVLFRLTHADWDLCMHLEHSIWEFAILTLPFVWLIFLFGFAGFAFFYFRRTKRGYRYPTVWVIAGSIILSLLSGMAVYKLGMAVKIEYLCSNRISFYRMIQKRRGRFWVAPERGFLAGEIMQVLPDDRFRLMDFYGRIWTVEAKEAVWKGRTHNLKNLVIKIIGKQGEANSFVAKEIRPWLGACRCSGQRSNCPGRRFGRHGPLTKSSPMGGLRKNRQ
jgi:hypothetical protein